jgi:hypothetical protein
MQIYLAYIKYHDDESGWYELVQADTIEDARIKLSEEYCNDFESLDFEISAPIQ